MRSQPGSRGGRRKEERRPKLDLTIMDIIFIKILRIGCMSLRREWISAITDYNAVLRGDCNFSKYVELI